MRNANVLSTAMRTKRKQSEQHGTAISDGTPGEVYAHGWLTLVIRIDLL